MELRPVTMLIKHFQQLFGLFQVVLQETKQLGQLENEEMDDPPQPFSNI